MKKFCIHAFCVIIVMSFSSNSLSQSNTQKPCSAAQASQFDFWIGDWNLSWNDSVRGNNRVVKLFGNCTVHENFTNPQTGYLGQSWSVYNSNYQYWQQTWVDSNGGYIALTGGMKGDSMVLTTGEQKVPVSISSTGKLISRMVYHNIKPDSFDWIWEASSDGGISWRQNWKIHYERRRP
ncbi:MAG: hypothetical protein ACXWV9_04945 [Flavisolibacter sp.]